MIVATPEIVKWRIQTVKLAGLVVSEQHDHPIDKICEGLSKNLRVIHELGSQGVDWPRARNAIHGVCKLAFELALALRTCKAEYAWHQAVLPPFFDETDVERIDGYNVDPRGTTGRLAKVLFGPVYKQVDGKPVLLVNGTVLMG